MLGRIPENPDKRSESMTFRCKTQDRNVRSTSVRHGLRSFGRQRRGLRMTGENRTVPTTLLGICVLALLTFASAVRAQESDVAKKLQGFDAYMEQTLKDWNTPGVGVGIVVNDKLVFAKGYGYRDYEKKLPFTAKTLQPIASNSKLFTAVAAGMLVEEGKLTWDKPVSFP